MITEYAVKKCKSLSFANNAEEARKLFKKDELSGNNVFYISDTTEDSPYGKAKCYLDLDELKKDEPWKSSTSAVLFVKLAKQSTRVINIDIHSDDINKLNLDETNEEYIASLKAINEDETALDKTELPNDFIVWLRNIFDKFKDSKLKSSILRLFRVHGVNDVEFISTHPIEYEEKTIEIIEHTPMFKDIKLVSDQNDVNTSSKNYTRSDNYLKNACAGNSTALEAFSSNKFTVIHGKKHASIDNKLINCNYDVLDSMARNGVICSPISSTQSSMSKLVYIAKQFKEFHICFIHPAIEYKGMRCEYPCQQLEPAYVINQGEICAIAYRYFVLNFFGYCSIKNNSMLEYDYIF
jgi:hypothetical protein